MYIYHDALQGTDAPTLIFFLTFGGQIKQFKRSRRFTQTFTVSCDRKRFPMLSQLTIQLVGEGKYLFSLNRAHFSKASLNLRDAFRRNRYKRVWLNLAFLFPEIKFFGLQGLCQNGCSSLVAF